MKIAKVLNNNIAIALDRDGNDVIVLGKGISFQKKRGDEIDASRIERIFTQHVSEYSLRLTEMTREIPEEYFEAVRHIVDDAKVELGEDMDDSIYLSLTDHVHFAVQRQEEGIPLHNRLLLETKMIYRDEYRVAARAVNYLNATFNVQLPEDEAAFIALHLVNATTSDSMGETIAVTELVQQIVTIVRNYFHVELDPDSLDYYRMMIHLKFFATRVMNRQTDAVPLGDDQLLSLVRSRYADSWACAERIAAFVEQARSYQVTEDEKMYLAIHIERVRHVAARS